MALTTPCGLAQDEGMTDTLNRWNDVQDELQSLAMKLDYHLRQASSKERADMEDAMKRIGDAVSGALDGIRNASTDPAILDDLRSFGSALASAVTATLSEVGEEIQKVMETRKDRVK